MPALWLPAVCWTDSTPPELRTVYSPDGNAVLPIWKLKGMVACKFIVCACSDAVSVAANNPAAKMSRVIYCSFFCRVYVVLGVYWSSFFNQAIEPQHS